MRYGFDGWQHIVDAPTLPNSLGVHVLTIDTVGTCARTAVGFHVPIHARGPLGGSGLSREHRLGRLNRMISTLLVVGAMGAGKVDHPNDTSEPVTPAH